MAGGGGAGQITTNGEQGQGQAGTAGQVAGGGQGGGTGQVAAGGQGGGQQEAAGQQTNEGGQNAEGGAGSGGGVGGGFAALADEGTDGIGSQDTPGGTSEYDNATTAHEAEAADLPPDPPGKGHTVPGALVLPPAPPVGTEKGRDITPHKVKTLVVSLPARKVLASPPQQASKPADKLRQPNPAVKPKTATKTPVGDPKKPIRKPVPIALTVGSTSKRGAVPIMVIDRPHLALGTPSGTVDPPLPPANGAAKSLTTAPKRTASSHSEEVSPTVDHLTRNAMSANKPKKPKRAIVRLVRNSEGIKEGTEQPLPATPMPENDTMVGDGSGLKGEYFQGPKFNTPVFQRPDPNINYNWVSFPSQSPGPKIPAFSDYSVRWTGRIAAQSSGTYTFYAAADDGVRVWIDHKLIIDAWTAHSLQQFSHTFTFKKGVQYLFKCEYMEVDAGGALVYLYWEGPGVPKQFVPEDAFFYPLPTDEEELKQDKAPL